MKKIAAFYCLLAFFSLQFVSANAQGITTPQASPAASVMQTVGISTIMVHYSRPSVKGRPVWGTLVPYGWNVQAFGNQKSAPWRAGANENTVLELSHPAKVEGQAVPAGRYGLFFVINKDDTGEVILSKDSRSWGSFFYDSTQDQIRTRIKLRAIPPTELLTYDFINLTKNSVELVLNWEKKQFPVNIEFAADDIVLANAAEELKGPIGFNWLGYSTAAQYTLQNKVSMDQGLAWIDQAIAQNRSFATLNTKAGLLKQMGKTSEANKIMQESTGSATEVELNQYGYQLLNGGQNDEAIKIMVLNTDRHPQSANAWDSLGEAYALKGDKVNAIKSFKKSLTLNPNAGTKANSEKYLKQLGAL